MVKKAQQSNELITDCLFSFGKFFSLKLIIEKVSELSLIAIRLDEQLFDN